MIEAVLMMGSLGIVIGAGLAVASKVFYVYVDPLIEEIEAQLPGANCGGCGFAGCGSYAAAVATGKSSPDLCVAGGQDVSVAIARIMGVSVGAKDPIISRLGCTFSVQEADVKFIYDGLSDCRAASLLSGGMKVCNIGCLGLGSCIKACVFNALEMGPSGLPVVIEDKCTGCGACEKACPKHIITMSSLASKILHEYTTEDCTTPCQRACPAGIDIPEYIRLISVGDYHKSVQVIKERNPFPTVIGRICPRPCETECRRQYVDEPVAINYLKRFVADYEKSVQKRINPQKATSSGKKIAVIGGGVEGLSTAFFSARLGHDVTVFEATSKLGGMLRTAIAKNRLPLEILDWDIEGILDIGVKAETSRSLGVHFTIDSLLAQKYESIFLATGGWDSRLSRGANLPAEKPFNGLFLLIDYVKYLQQDDIKELKCPVVFVEGGDMVVDFALQCKAKGAKNVILITRETTKISPFGLREEQLIASGITVIFHAAITKLKGKGSALTGLEYTDLTTGAVTELHVANLVMASGRIPEMIITLNDSQLNGTSEPESELDWIAFEPYKKPDFKKEKGFFSDGDTLSDFNAAIKAIGAGRRAAASMHKAISGMTLSLQDHVITSETVLQDVDHVDNVDVVPRKIMPLCCTSDHMFCEETELGFSKEMASAEASRCLRCGLICYKQSCKITENN